MSVQLNSLNPKESTITAELNSFNPSHSLQASTPSGQASTQGQESESVRSSTMSRAQKLGMGALAGALIGVLNAIAMPKTGPVYNDYKLTGALLKHLPIFAAESLLIRGKILGFISISSALIAIGCNGCIQHTQLTLCPKALIKKFAPGKEAIVDSKTAKVARIAFMTSLYLGLFTLRANSTSEKLLLSTALLTQLIGSSVMKETKAGFLGSMGTHFTARLITSLLL